jgi:hypothetical protein
MKITKELKNATFEYDEETKSFTLSNNETKIELNKIYAFAFMRFVVRMAQRNWLRQSKKTQKSVVCSEQDLLGCENFDHPDQIQLFE